mmetsp:Transcript_21959/g.47534  ORF Transcript_21959/g.47534 Transcript_21959/m.47534 type:complete len:93 (-) Transcript_21959:1548-1826(-)
MVTNAVGFLNAKSIGIHVEQANTHKIMATTSNSQSPFPREQLDPLASVRPESKKADEEFGCSIDDRTLRNGSFRLLTEPIDPPLVSFSKSTT